MTVQEAIIIMADYLDLFIQDDMETEAFDMAFKAPLKSKYRKSLLK